jgi:hypothetical protein
LMGEVRPVGGGQGQHLGDFFSRDAHGR